MNLHRAPQSLSARFRQPQMPDFAFLDQLRHGADSLLDWGIRIHAVLIVEINRLHTQSTQTAFARLPNIFRFTTDSPHIRIAWVANDAELGCQHNLVAASTNGFADQFLVSKWSVHVGGIEEIDTEFQRTVNRG